MFITRNVQKTNYPATTSRISSKNEAKATKLEDFLVLEGVRGHEVEAVLLQEKELLPSVRGHSQRISLVRSNREAFGAYFMHLY